MSPQTRIVALDKLNLHWEPSQVEALVHHTVHSALRGDDMAMVTRIVNCCLELRTLGSDHGFVFNTYEMSSSSIYATSANIERYPFIKGSTILEGRLFLVENGQKNAKSPYVDFLAKIVKEVSATETRGIVPAGFVLSIIQMNAMSMAALSNFIVQELRNN